MPTQPKTGAREQAADPSERRVDGVVVHCASTWVRLAVRTPQIIRVTASSRRAFLDRDSLVVVPPSDHPYFRVLEDATAIAVDTGVVRATLDRATGQVRFTDSSGKTIAAEADRTFEPAVIQGVNTFHVRQQWHAQDESLYGLGQHQFDTLNLKGLSIDLWQRNTSIVSPLLVSSRGYGLFWDNLGYTRFGDLRPWQPLAGHEFDEPLGEAEFEDTHFERKRASGSAGEVNIDLSKNRDLVTADGTPATRPAVESPFEKSKSIRWTTRITPARSGDYQFHNYSNGYTKVTIDNSVIFDHWRQGWLPADDVAKIHLEAYKSYPIVAEWSREGGGDVYKLDYKPPADSDDTSLWSEFGDGVNCYLIAGGNIDGVIAGMRELTGKAILPPQWVFGLWQSRQRYETQQASLDVIDGFRKRHIPFDNIVQDWQYWQRDQWGSHGFDAQRFPDPVGWINAIHAQHAHLMISVWGKFYAGTHHYDELLKRGFLYTLNITLGTKDFIGFPFTNYDAFNPEARKLFWQQMKACLFDKGVDAWWMDATEPDLEATPTLNGLHARMNPTAAGPSASVLNGYALQNARAVYEGQRAAAPDARFFNLTRSGYAGQQRYGAASWSGDITSTWTALRKQVPAGLNFCLSGVPYWTMDCGGFAVPPRFGRHATTQAIDEWRELNTRWFELAAFVPLLRVHGEFSNREMWEFGGETSDAYRAMLKFDRLRYRLFPYIYSTAAEVTHTGGTILRALPFDFADDPQARDRTDQFLFGRSILVSPITTYGARRRSVYLPRGADWYDFWTGQHFTGGQQIEAAAPYDQIPLHLRAGSILPIGPEQQYIGEKPADTITLMIYTGADGDFTLYEDDGLTNAYERGEFTTIAMHWNDADHTLTIGPRRGSFDGMLKQRTFNIVLVDANKSVGFNFDLPSDRVVRYDGAPAMVK